jgi:hypothetical protein
MFASLEADRIPSRSHPNDKDKLPGPLQQLRAARNQDAAPVKLNFWLGRNAIPRAEGITPQANLQALT